MRRSMAVLIACVLALAGAVRGGQIGGVIHPVR